MLSRRWFAALLAGVLIAGSTFSAQEQADNAPATAITIYADLVHSSSEARGRGLVQQRRQVELPQGEGLVELPDVPASLEPASVLLRPVEDEGGFAILEQFSRAVTADPDSVLRQYIGHDVLINRVQPATGQQTRVTETINAKLLAFDDQVLVLQTNNRQLPIQIIARGPDVSEIKLMRAPTMPATRPALAWRVASEKAGSRAFDLIYEARGFAWDAHYTLLLEGGGGAGSFEAWANIVNRSGTGFADAVVRLVAEQERSRPYPLPRRVTLPADGARRVALLEGSRRVRCERANVLAEYLGTDVAECLSIANSPENQLGTSLPPGRVRVLRLGAENNETAATAALLSESRVSATAAGRAMLVRLGRAEGLVATRAVAESREIIDGDRQVVRTNKVTIGNRRKENARVLVVERLEDGARRVIQHSHPLGAGPAPDSITFAVDVPAGASLTVSYAAAVEGS